MGRAVLGLVLVGACQSSDQPSDTEKRARIELLYESYRPDLGHVPEMTVATLMERLSGPEPPVLVDVRDAAERQVSMIPGAVSKQELEAHPERFAGRGVVAYCTIGYRSGLYTRKLVDVGWKAFNLRGGILAWTHGGGELDHDGAPTRGVHVYGATWDLAASGYEAVW
jgi:rhodanese-related sulfurtransferase